MKERPILFSGAMVRAILDGRKTQTRRVIRPQPEPGTVREAGLTARLCPYGAPGDVLWVRETWAPMCRLADPTCWCEDDDEKARNHYIEYRADTGNPRPGDWPAEESGPDVPRWRPSIHMPRRASRILLEVVDVRVERLQDITRDDAKAEGIKERWTCLNPGTGSYAPDNDVCEDFRGLWDGINGKRGYGWETNPWVWVVSFRPIDAGGRSS